MSIGKITEHAGQCGRLVVTGEDIAAAVTAGASAFEVWKELVAISGENSWGLEGSDAFLASFEAARERAGEQRPTSRIPGRRAS